MELLNVLFQVGLVALILILVAVFYQHAIKVYWSIRFDSAMNRTRKRLYQEVTLPNTVVKSKLREAAIVYYKDVYDQVVKQLPIHFDKLDFAIFLDIMVYANKDMQHPSIMIAKYAAHRMSTQSEASDIVFNFSAEAFYQFLQENYKGETQNDETRIARHVKSD